MPLRLGPREFPDGVPLVMAVVNRTPDSFHDRGATFELPAALDAVDRAVAAGADIVDIGGVKAGPGPAVDEPEEIRRTAELVAAARRRHPGLVLSVDTWRSGVAEAAAVAGVNMLNDAWGCPDRELPAVAARHRLGLVCTHAGGLPPRTRPHRVGYPDVMADVVATTTRLARRAVRLGVPADGVLVDPGHDFGKNTWHSLEVTRRLGELVATRWPVLVSVSRKDFVGETLDRSVADRLMGTLAVTAVCAWLGARVFRVHDVAETRDVVDMVAALRGVRPPRTPRRGLA